MSIRKKILLSLILVGLLPSIIILWFTYLNGTKIVQQNIGENFKEIAMGSAREINLILHKEIDEALHHASHAHVQDALSRANALYNSNSGGLLRQARTQDEHWQETTADSAAVLKLTKHPIVDRIMGYGTRKEEHINITLIDAHGVAVASLKKPRRFFYGDDLIWNIWKEGKRASETSGFISDFFPTGEGRYGMEVAVKVHPPSGPSLGVLVITYDVEKLFSGINAIKIGETGHANVVRSDGMMLIDPLLPPMSLKVDDEFLKIVAKPSPGWALADDEHGGVNAILGYAPVPLTSALGPAAFGGRQWHVFLGLSPEETYAPFRSFLLKMAFLGLIFIVLISVFAQIISKRILHPLASLKTGAEMIGKGKLDYNIDIHTGDEVEALANEFNEMTRKLRESRRMLMDWNAELEQEIKRRTYDLRIANEELRRADRMKSEFLANMSHELRTPLNSIIGFSEVLSDQLHGPLSEKQLRHVSNILISGRHLLQLINDILDLSKVEAGKMELHYNVIPLREFFENIMMGFRLQIQKKGLVVSYEVDGVDRVIADVTRFKQILLNIVSNAIKFSLENGRITLLARRNGDFIEISVTDTGIGINKENQQVIFQEFRQIDASFTRKYEGTGLGLALTKKLVELHGGKIWVDSEEGRGSTFTISIPDREKKAAGGGYIDAS